MYSFGQLILYDFRRRERHALHDERTAQAYFARAGTDSQRECRYGWHGSGAKIFGASFFVRGSRWMDRLRKLAAS